MDQSAGEREQGGVGQSDVCPACSEPGKIVRVSASGTQRRACVAGHMWSIRPWRKAGRITLLKATPHDHPDCVGCGNTLMKRLTLRGFSCDKCGCNMDSQGREIAKYNKPQKTKKTKYVGIKAGPIIYPQYRYGCTRLS